MKSLKSEDLDNLQSKLQEKDDKGENKKKENPLLLAAEYGSYKILKDIIRLKENLFNDNVGKEDDLTHREEFTFDDCNEKGENILHLSKFHKFFW